MRNKNIETRVQTYSVAEMINSGMTRQEIMKALTDQGIAPNYASKYYYMALKDLAPTPDLIDDYKKGMIQVNLDRLEKIVNETIDGNFQNKAIALKAIEQINKMLNITGNNEVVINKNNKGDEQIIISFGD
jgi:hypothetical protein